MKRLLLLLAVVLLAGCGPKGKAYVGFSCLMPDRVVHYEIYPTEAANNDYDIWAIDEDHNTQQIVYTSSFDWLMEFMPTLKLNCRALGGRIELDEEPTEI